MAQMGSQPVPHHEQIRLPHLAGTLCGVSPGHFCSGDSLLSITAIHPKWETEAWQQKLFFAPL